MPLDLVAGLLEIAGQRAGTRGQQPEQEKSHAVDSHAADLLRLSADHHQFQGIEYSEKYAGSDTGHDKGWPEDRDDTLDNGYPGAALLQIGADIHGLCPIISPVDW